MALSVVAFLWLPAPGAAAGPGRRGGGGAAAGARGGAAGVGHAAGFTVRVSTGKNPVWERGP